MIKDIICTAVQRASKDASNAEGYLMQLRKFIESDIRHQIKLHGGQQSFDISTRFHLGFDDVDGFYQEISTNVINVGNGKEMGERVRLSVLPNTMLDSLRGIFHHCALKSKQASDAYFSGGVISSTQLTLQNELAPLFGNHKAIVVVNHSRTGNCAVDVELIQVSLKSLGKMVAALERGLPSLDDDMLPA